MDGPSRKHAGPCEETVAELLTLGFDTLLRERYERYQRGEISFGGLAKELGITAWELSHLLEERGWAAYQKRVGVTRAVKNRGQNCQR